MYKRAVDKVIDELLQDYTNGDRTPVVTAVHEWQNDPQELENVKDDNFKRVLNDYLGGKKPPTEDELYNGFKEYVSMSDKTLSFFSISILCTSPFFVFLFCKWCCFWN